MNVKRSITALSSVAVLGSVALAPLAALADTSAGASVDVHIKHSLFQGYGYGNDMHGDDVRASSSARVKMQDKVDDRLEKVEDHTHAALNARVSLLRNLAARIERMKRLGDDDKAALNAQIQAQLADLNASTTSSTTLKMHMRAFAVIAPRAAIMAAGDRIIAIVDAMDTVSDKLAARIDAAKAAGKDVSASESAYADFKVKIADAQVQANAAIDLVEDLKASDVDQAALDADKKAITEARAKIKTAAADLKAARKDMKTIIEGTKGVHATATTTAETH
jgi:hypothetical protein